VILAGANSSSHYVNNSTMRQLQSGTNMIQDLKKFNTRLDFSFLDRFLIVYLMSFYVYGNYERLGNKKIES